MYHLTVAQTPGDRHLVARMRYRAYHAVNAIPACPNELFEDAFDDLPHARTFIAWQGETPVAATRTLCSRQPPAGLTTAGAFADVLERVLPPAATVVEANRFVVDPQHADHARGVVWTLFRANLMRCTHEHADLFVAGIRPEHTSIYRRVLHLDVVSEARRFPGLTCDMHLVVADCRAALPAIYAARPALWTRPEERTALLGGEVTRAHLPPHQTV